MDNRPQKPAGRSLFRLCTPRRNSFPATIQARRSRRRRRRFCLARIRRSGCGWSGHSLSTLARTPSGGWNGAQAVKIRRYSTRRSSMRTSGSAPLKSLAARWWFWFASITTDSTCGLPATRITRWRPVRGEEARAAWSARSPRQPENTVSSWEFIFLPPTFTSCGRTPPIPTATMETKVRSFDPRFPPIRPASRRILPSHARQQRVSRA